jgi:hypothetical protein
MHNLPQSPHSRVPRTITGKLPPILEAQFPYLQDWVQVAVGRKRLLVVICTMRLTGMVVMGTGRGMRTGRGRMDFPGKSCINWALVWALLERICEW